MGRLARLWRENRLTLIVVFALATGYFALRTPASAVASVAEVTERLGQGQPTVLYFFSNT
jgi:hypothetical protein